MRPAAIAFLLALAPALAPTVARGETGPAFANPMASVHADAWPTAEAAVADAVDPVARKLVTYYRMLAPNAASAADIAAFTEANPLWPSGPLLETRREEALANDPDDVAALAQCRARTPARADALLRCATAYANSGNSGAASAAARRAWVGISLIDPAQETAFMQRWGSVITPDDQWDRFIALAWSSQTAAAAGRQVARLDTLHRKIAGARLALIGRQDNALTLIAALPAGSTDPGMFLDWARYLRMANKNADALALWTAEGGAAQTDAPDRAGLFWAERNRLARVLLHDGDANGAYAIASAGDKAMPEPDLDTEFLAGFIALRKLNDPDRAAAHFKVLADASPAVITQSRAHYWLGRAAAAAKHDPKPEYAQAAKYPLVFYGQLAARALGETPAQLAGRINGLHDPAWTIMDAMRVTGSEIGRAAAMLVGWGEPRRASQFLLRADDIASDPGQRAAVAHLAGSLGDTVTGVFIARRMGTDGLMLPNAGWPMAPEPPGDKLDPAIGLGIIRQESSFDAGALSPAGARGLMQLMPATAQAVAKQLNETTSATTLMADPAGNMRLGTAYLRQMLDQFAQSLPLAVAAYNAGPNRVQEWLGANGDPRADGGPDMIDWVELIPFTETRNYVERVLENVIVYRAKRGEKAQDDLTLAER